MPYTKHKKTSKAKPVSLFFLFVLAGLTILVSTTSIANTPTVLVAKTLPINPLEILTIPVVQTQKTTENPPQKIAKKTPEARLKIPKIGVDAAIKEMGVTPDGAMAVPGNRIDVGWYSFGTLPGEIGSAVIGGHNRWNSGAGVFARLDQLKKGDILSVVDANGVSTSFVVKHTRTFDATDEESGIFKSDSGAHLNLITCSGAWNPLTQSYTTRLVVFTDAIQTADEIAMAQI